MFLEFGLVIDLPVREHTRCKTNFLRKFTPLKDLQVSLSVNYTNIEKKVPLEIQLQSNPAFTNSQRTVSYVCYNRVSAIPDFWNIDVKFAIIMKHFSVLIKLH